MTLEHQCSVDTDRHEIWMYSHHEGAKLSTAIFVCGAKSIVASNMKE